MFLLKFLLNDCQNIKNVKQKTNKNLASKILQRTKKSLLIIENIISMKKLDQIS